MYDPKPELGNEGRRGFRVQTLSSGSQSTVAGLPTESSGLTAGLLTRICVSRIPTSSLLMKCVLGLGGRGIA